MGFVTFYGEFPFFSFFFPSIFLSIWGCFSCYIVLTGDHILLRISQSASLSQPVFGLVVVFTIFLGVWFLDYAHSVWYIHSLPLIIISFGLFF